MAIDNLKEIMEEYLRTIRLTITSSPGYERYLEGKEDATMHFIDLLARIS